jgi:hypothetical protein
MRKLNEEHLMKILVIIGIIILAIFVPYYIGGISIHGYHAIHSPEIGNPSYYYYLGNTDPFWNGTFAQWSNGLLWSIIIFAISMTLWGIWYLLYVLYDWLFPKQDTRAPYTPEKDNKGDK